MNLKNIQKAYNVTVESFFWNPREGYRLRGEFAEYITRIVASNFFKETFISTSEQYLKDLKKLGEIFAYEKWREYILSKPANILGEVKIYSFLLVDLINNELTKFIEVKANLGRRQIRFGQTVVLFNAIKSGNEAYLSHCLYTNPNLCSLTLWRIKSIIRTLGEVTLSELERHGDAVLEKMLSCDFTIAWKSANEYFEFEENNKKWPWTPEINEFPVGEVNHSKRRIMVYDYKKIMTIRKALFPKFD